MTEKPQTLIRKKESFTVRVPKDNLKTTSSESELFKMMMHLITQVTRAEEYARKGNDIGAWEILNRVKVIYLKYQHKFKKLDCELKFEKMLSKKIQEVFNNNSKEICLGLVSLN